jgi:hypothetical protein
MYGTASDPVFANDGAMASAKRREQFQQERQELKSVLREGFGIGKGGTGKPDPAEQPALRIELEDEDGTSTGKDSTTQTPRRGIGKPRDKGPEKEEQERIQLEDP